MMTATLPDFPANRCDSERPLPHPDQVERRGARRGPLGLPYLRTRARAAISFAIAGAWVACSVLLSQRWIADLESVMGLGAALILIAGIAWIPGYLNMQLLVALAFDKPPELPDLGTLPDLTVLVAAHNEARDLAWCTGSILAQEYSGQLHVIVIDDGSLDATAAVASQLAELDERLSVISKAHEGKAVALNEGLAAADDWLVATVDADTILAPQALQRAVTRMLLQPSCVAVAGAVLVRNHDSSAIARMQTHDYMLSIASVKRAQALLGSTLVAQGAFSVYMSSALREIGGWPDMIGEDIVMTWGLLARGGSVSFEPTAVAWTDVPASLSAFARQRQRWARGMIEGLRRYGVTLLRRPGLLRHSIVSNLTFPYLDAVVTFAFIPGLVLALFGHFLLVGPMTIAVLPISVAIALVMRLRQRRALAQIGLVPPAHAGAFWGWLLGYQLLVSPIALSGYVAEAIRRPRHW